MTLCNPKQSLGNHTTGETHKNIFTPNRCYYYSRYTFLSYFPVFLSILTFQFIFFACMSVQVHVCYKACAKVIEQHFGVPSCITHIDEKIWIVCYIKHQDNGTFFFIVVCFLLFNSNLSVMFLFLHAKYLPDFFGR